MNNKHRKTLKAIFATPTNGNIEWREIESLLKAIGCEVLEETGSAVSFKKDGFKVTFHRPHPSKIALKYRVKRIQKFLDKLETN
jgi:hypothetical protein